MHILLCLMACRRQMARALLLFAHLARGIRCYRDAVAEGWAHIALRSVEKNDTQVVDILGYDEAGQPVAELRGLRVRLLPLDQLQPHRAETDDRFYRVAWRRSTRTPANQVNDRTPASWLIFSDAKGVGEALARQLEARQHHCHLVFRNQAFSQQSPRVWTIDDGGPAIVTGCSSALRAARRCRAEASSICGGWTLPP